jgi:hypothetical protein
LYHAKCSASAAFRFNHFLENPFVRRVSLRMQLRIVKVLQRDMRRANLGFVWDSVDGRGDRLRKARRALAPLIYRNVQRVDFD